MTSFNNGYRRGKLYKETIINIVQLYIKDILTSDLLQENHLRDLGEIY